MHDVSFSPVRGLATLFVSCIGLGLPVAAQTEAPAAESWSQLQATFVHQGKEVRVTLRRAEGDVRLQEKREGRSARQHPPRTLSPALLERLEAALGKATSATSRRVAGQFLVDGTPINGRALAGVLGVVAESVLRGGEPERVELSGRLREGGGVLRTRDGTDYALTGIHAGWDRALGMLPSAQLELLVWPGSTDAVVAGIRVQATRHSIPYGVPVNDLVKVIGLTTVAERSVQRNLGPRKVGGRVLLVVDDQGRRGTLHDPGSARAPLQPRGESLGAVGALGGLGR